MRQVDPGLHQAGGGPDPARRHPRVADQGPGPDRADVRADGAAHRAGPRRHVGRPLLVDHDGRLRQQRPDLRRGLPHAGGAHPDDQRRYKWIGENYFQTMGNPVLAGRRLDVERCLHGSARRRWSPRTSRASTGRIRRSRSAGGSATRPSSPWRTIVGVVGDERDDGVTDPRRQSSTGRWSSTRCGPTTMMVSRTMAFAIRSERADSPTLLKEVQQAVWAVNAELPVASGPDARRDPCRIDGADLLRAGDAQHRRGSGAAARGRRHLRRHLVHRDAADARDRDPHGARRGAARREHAVPPPRTGADRRSASRSASPAPRRSRG